MADDLYDLYRKYHELKNREGYIPGYIHSDKEKAILADMERRLGISAPAPSQADAQSSTDAAAAVTESVAREQAIHHKIEVAQHIRNFNAQVWADASATDGAPGNTVSPQPADPGLVAQSAAALPSPSPPTTAAATPQAEETGLAALPPEFARDLTETLKLNARFLDQLFAQQQKGEHGPDKFQAAQVLSTLAKNDLPGSALELFQNIGRGGFNQHNVEASLLKFLESFDAPDWTKLLPKPDPSKAKPPGVLRETKGKDAAGNLLLNPEYAGVPSEEPKVLAKGELPKATPDFGPLLSPEGPDDAPRLLPLGNIPSEDVGPARNPATVAKEWLDRLPRFKAGVNDDFLEARTGDEWQSKLPVGRIPSEETPSRKAASLFDTAGVPDAWKPPVEKVAPAPQLAKPQFQHEGFPPQATLSDFFKEFSSPSDPPMPLFTPKIASRGSGERTTKGDSSERSERDEQLDEQTDKLDKIGEGVRELATLGKQMVSLLAPGGPATVTPSLSGPETADERKVSDELARDTRRLARADGED